MDVRFDSAAAERLLIQMERYSSGVYKESKELKSLIADKSEWDDNQRRAFCANIEVITKELDIIIQREKEYMEIFGQKVKELQG